MPMPAFSLFCPMQGLPWYLLPIWPLVYLRIQRLDAWFKANDRPGSHMLWAIANHGRVDVVYLSDDMCALRKHPWVPIPLPGSFNAALARESQAPPQALLAHQLFFVGPNISARSSVACMRWSTMPGSIEEWPASGMMCSSAFGQTLDSAQAVDSGVTTS